MRVTIRQRTALLLLCSITATTENAGLENEGPRGNVVTGKINVHSNELKRQHVSVPTHIKHHATRKIAALYRGRTDRISLTHDLDLDLPPRPSIPCKCKLWS